MKTVITFTSLVLTAGFCDGGNYAAAVVSVTLFGYMAFKLSRREEHGREREAGKVARRYDRSA